MFKKMLTFFIIFCIVTALLLTSCASTSTTSTTGATAATTKAASAATTTSGPAVSTTATAGQTINLKFAHGYAPEHQFAIGADKIAAEINSKSNGRLNVKVYPAGQLGSEKDLVDGLTTGSVDMTMAGPGELGKRYKPVLIFDGPFIFRDVDHMMNAVNGPVGKELWDGMAVATGLRVITTLYTGSRYITTSKTPITTPKDLNGLKLRVPDQPLSVANAKAMGASPTPIAFAEVYLALQQGVVDGQENPLAQIMSAKFYEVQKYISLTGHVMQAIPVVISDKRLSSLPADLQKVVVDAVKNNAVGMNQSILDFEQKSINDLKAKGIQVIQPDIQAFRTATQPVIKEFETQWGQGLYEKIQAVK